MNRRWGYLMLIASILLLQGCVWKPQSKGNAGTLLIVTEPNERIVNTSAYLNTFGKLIQTPQDESIFKPIETSFNKLDLFARYPLILIVTRLDLDAPVANYVRRMLSRETIAEIHRTGSVAFIKQNPWARSQLLMIVEAKDGTDLNLHLESCLSRLTKSATASEITRIQNVSLGGNHRQFERRLTDSNLKWNLSLPVDFKLMRESDSLCYTSFLRTDPHSWISISWSEPNAPDSLTGDLILKHRRKIGRLLDSTMTAYSYSEETTTSMGFGGPALGIFGLWQSAIYGDGGPYRTYGFRESSTGRLIFIDYSLFAPGKEKAPFLWQLEAIIQTFNISNYK